MTEIDQFMGISSSLLYGSDLNFSNKSEMDIQNYYEMVSRMQRMMQARNREYCRKLSKIVKYGSKKKRTNKIRGKRK